MQCLSRQSFTYVAPSQRAVGEFGGRKRHPPIFISKSWRSCASLIDSFIRISPTQSSNALLIWTVYFCVLHPIILTVYMLSCLDYLYVIVHLENTSQSLTLMNFWTTIDDILLIYLIWRCGKSQGEAYYCEECVFTFHAWSRSLATAGQQSTDIWLMCSCITNIDETHDFSLRHTHVDSSHKSKGNARELSPIL